MSDEVDLSRAMLIVDGHHGIYTPQVFAEVVDRGLLRLSPPGDQLDLLLAGPEVEDYWDVWTEVLDGASYVHPELGLHTVEQIDGDVWLVPTQP